MRKFMLLILVFSVLNATGQNEFGATAFYNDFRQIYADAPLGFARYKGMPVKGQSHVYTVKLLIPLADSGRIVENATECYVEYYFQPAKKKEDAYKRALNLRLALVTSVEHPVSTRTETPVIDGYPYSTTYFYANTSGMEKGSELFWYSVYQKNGRYYISLHIPGKIKAGTQE